MVEAIHALATAIDPERDVKAGDLFWVHYEQEYTVEGDPIGIGRVLWAELRTAAKGTVAIHRFRANKSSAEPFWLATGQSTETTSVRLPPERISISSGFGLRADPFDQPTSQAAMGPVRARSAAGPKAKAANTLGKGTSPVDAEARAMMARAGALPPGLASRLDAPRFERAIITGESGLTNPSFANGLTGARNGNGPAPPGLSIDLAPLSPRGAAAPLQGAAARAVAPRANLVMHQGIDLLAEPGTPVLAAADGVVTDAAPNGGYGNWIEIKTSDSLGIPFRFLFEARCSRLRSRPAIRSPWPCRAGFHSKRLVDQLVVHQRRLRGIEFAHDLAHCRST
jgi:murein DD-endopeptidase MepM/ murein hydrolase activator NlpD